MTIELNGIVEVAGNMYASLDLRHSDCTVEEYTVVEGEVFATFFMVIDINESGILLFYGDERIEVPLNQEQTVAQ